MKSPSRIGKAWKVPSVVDEETGEIVGFDITVESNVREVITSIKDDISSARTKLYFLYENQAWLTLGYNSWHELLTNEFTESHSYLRRMAHAAQIEASVGVSIGTHAESHLRALYEVLPTEKEQQRAYQLAVDHEAKTAQDFRKAAWAVYSDERGTQVISQRLTEGYLSPAQAYGLTLVAEQAESALIKEVISRCSDPELARMILKLSEKGGETFQEIVLSQTIPALPDPIPLEQATASNLRAWLDLASAEHRAVAIETNRDRYTQLDEILAELFKAVQALTQEVGLDDPSSFRCVKLMEDYRYVKANRKGAEETEVQAGVRPVPQED